MVDVIPVLGKKKSMMGPGKVSSLNLIFILAHLEEKEWNKIARKLCKYDRTEKNHCGFSKVK